jgi:glycosyltransferase involved in cell wall biosynthesis
VLRRLRSGLVALLGASRPSEGGASPAEVERFVALPLDRTVPVTAPPGLVADVVDLVVTLDVDDVSDRPDVIARLGEVAQETGWHLIVVVYEAEEAVGKVHAPPVVPPTLPLLEGRVARGWSTAVGWAVPHLQGTRAVLLDSTVVVSALHLRRLVGELGDGDEGPVVVQGVLRRVDGTVATAGALRLSPLVAPASLLEGHPAEDSERLGLVDVFAADAPVLAVRSSGLTAPPPTTDMRLAVAGLSREVARRAGPRARVVSTPCGRSLETRPPVRSLDAGAQDLLVAWRALSDVDGPRALARLGFEVTLDVPVSPVPPGERAGIRVSRPLLRRSVGRAALVLEPTPRLRWSLKTAAWPGERGDDWGDTHFARDLARALTGLGQDVVVDRRLSHARPGSDDLDDVSLVLRGLDRTPLSPSALNVLWVISHPDLVSPGELGSFDLRFAASETWAGRVSDETGHAVEPLLQATDPGRFAPGPVDAELVSDVLFVGRTRGVFRPVVRDAVAAGLDVSVWGDGWSGLVPPGVVRGESLPNERLPAAYRSARVVLNDHWADMAREGFVSNRIFDALATGAPVVSDSVPGLSDSLGGLVRTYETPDDLRRIVLDIEREPEEARAERARSVAEHHSFDARARLLLDRVLVRLRTA